MRSPFLAVLTAALLASVAGARAQSMYPGGDVTVNPAAGANQILLYPGGQYMRVVPPLRQPGATNQPIHLHMPRSASTAKAAMPRVTRGEPAVVPPVSKPAPSRVARAKPPAPVQTAPVRTASLPSAAPPPTSLPLGAGAIGILASPTAPVTQIAKAPPPQTTQPAGATDLGKRSVILFAPNTADPAQSALGAIKFLAGDLNAALGSASSRIQILAYGGAHGDKSSDARRLSLKRALAIRQVLIDDGVPAERIDVSAMGGADDGGPLDRVDVYIRA